MTALLGVAYIGATIKIPSLLTSRYQLSQDSLTAIMTLLAASGILSGIGFGVIYHCLKERTLLAMLCLMGLGQFLLTLPYQPILIILAVILIGFSFVATMSATFHLLSITRPVQERHFATSLILTAGNIGVALTPILLKIGSQLLGRDPLKTPFYLTSFLILLAIALSYFLGKFPKKSLD